TLASDANRRCRHSLTKREVVRCTGSLPPDSSIRQRTPMARPKWTVMLVPHGNEQVKSIEISSSGIRTVISIALIAALLSATFCVGFFVQQGQRVEAMRLERANVLLAAEVEAIQGRMEV